MKRKRKFKKMSRQRIEYIICESSYLAKKDLIAEIGKPPLKEVKPGVIYKNYFYLPFEELTTGQSFGIKYINDLTTKRLKNCIKGAYHRYSISAKFKFYYHEEIQWIEIARLF